LQNVHAFRLATRSLYELYRLKSTPSTLLALAHTFTMFE